MFSAAKAGRAPQFCALALMWMAENHHGSESKRISRRKDHAGNEWTASQSGAKKDRTHGQQQRQQQQQQQQQQRRREQQPAPVIDLRVAHAMAMQSSPSASACDGSKKEAETERLRVI